MANYFVGCERSAPGVTLETKVVWRGPLPWLDIGFQRVSSDTMARSHAARCQIRLQHAGPELGDDASHHVACTANIEWYLSSSADAVLRQSVNVQHVQLLLAPVAGEFEVVIGLTWLPDAISLSVNGIFTSGVQILARESFDTALLDPFIFLALPALAEFVVQLVPLPVLLQTGAIEPWCSICAEEDPRRWSGRCHCGRFYCSLHGGECFSCERGACGFCLLEHAVCHLLTLSHRVG